MSHAHTFLGKILVFRPSVTDPPALIDLLRQVGDVRVESSRGSALAALASERFDVFVSMSAQLPAPGGGVGSRQLNDVLDALGQGVCIVDPDGRVQWCNAKLDGFPGQVRERIRRHCLEICQKSQGRSLSGRPRALSLVTEDDGHYDVTITPIMSQDEQTVRLVAAVSDVTRARRLQQKMDAIDNAGRELVRVDADQLAKMDVRQRLDLFERKIIRYTRELLDFDNFAIRLLDKDSGKLELVLCAGLPPEAQQIDVYASTENNGISGYVAATGRSYICPDVGKDSRYIQGIDKAASSLTVPLWLHDHVIGILNIESDGPAAFSEEDRQFAEIFGRYVAIALHILDLLVVERHTTTGRLADNVSAEIAAPLSDILTDATTLMEDYIGHDDLRHRLQAIADNVVKARDAIKQVTEPVGGILGSRPQLPEVDPLLVGKSVLVIDDEEIIRQTVRDVLAKWGCEVDMARDGTEALAMINCRSYDLVISDIRMPGRSGYEIFAAVKETDAGCPVIFMTGFGYDPNHSIIRACREGLATVLYKPFKVDQLLGEVRKAVSRSPDARK